MERTWRWFGKKDKITLAQLKQIGVEGIVTALHDVPLGEVWTREKIHELKEYIESYGMKWSVVESLPVVETIKKYIARGLDMDNLKLIPLVLAGYARYLKGIDDNGNAFEPSTDPLLEELQAIVAPLEIGKADQDYSCLKKLYTRKDVFGLDLYEAGLGEQIEDYVKELYAGNGAVRKTLHKYVSVR